MLTWAVLAGAALTYIGIFAVNPDSRLMATKPVESDQESNRAELQRSQLTAQVRTLKETVSSLRADLARLAEERENKQAQLDLPDIVPLAANDAEPATNPIKTGSTPPPANNSGPSTKGTIAPETPPPSGGIQQPEPAASPTPATAVLPPVINSTQPVARPPTAAASSATSPTSVPAASAQPAAEIKPKQRGPNLAISPLAPGRLPPLPDSVPQQAADPTATGPTQLQRTAALRSSGPATTVSGTNAPTAAAQKPATQARPPQPTSTQQNFGVARVTEPRTKPAAAIALSTATSVTGLRASWLLLTSQHPTVLAGYKPRYIKDSGSDSYRLVAGPIADRSEADSVCTSLRIQGVNCGVADYRGVAF